MWKKTIILKWKTARWGVRTKISPPGIPSPRNTGSDQAPLNIPVSPKGISTKMKLLNAQENTSAGPVGLYKSSGGRAELPPGNKTLGARPWAAVSCHEPALGPARGHADTSQPQHPGTTAYLYLISELQRVLVCLELLKHLGTVLHCRGQAGRRKQTAAFHHLTP